MPAIIASLQLLLFLLVFRFDTPIFYKNKNDVKNYEKMISLLYIKDSEENKDIKSNEEENKSDIEEQKENIRSKVQESITFPPLKNPISETQKSIVDHNSNSSDEDRNSKNESNLQENEALEDKKENEVIVKKKSWPSHYK